MGLTQEEEEELRRLEAEEAAAKDADEGDRAVETVDAHRTKPRKAQTRPFSFYRATVGALRDVAQDTIDFGADVMVGLMPAQADAALRRKQAKGELSLPTLKGEEDAGVAEKVVREIGSYIVPFAGWSKVFGVTKAASWLGRAGRAMAAGAATDAMQDPTESNLANALRDGFGLDSDILDALATEDDDERLYARFKAAAVNAPVGLAADAVLEGGFRMVKAYRAWRGSFEEADAAVKAARPLPLERSLTVADEAIDGESTARAAGAGAKAKDAPDAHWTRTDKPPESFEDILDFLKRKSGLGEMDPELLSRFAANLVDGNPENALAKLGIDPIKLDYSQFDNPDLLGRLHKGLAEVYEGIAQRLGRSGIRITEEQTAMAARSLATTADVLKDLYGHTSNLAETMMASRLFVGSHAHKLVAQAESAMKALKAGQGDREWLEFLESFQRHAYFMGALRGAGSEVGRALRSLQMIAKVGKTTAKRNVDEAVEADAKRTATSSQSVASQAADAVTAMTDPGERILLLSKLIEKGGDVGDLSRFVRTKSGSKLRRLDTALGETRGNLFSSATAALNTLSGITFMGMNGASKMLALAGRMALSPFGKAHSMAARVQALETWAYVDGVLGGWRDAFRNTMALLEREGMEELHINLHSLGAKGLASKAAALSAEGSSRVRGNFERVDINAHERAFAMTPSDLRAIQEQIDAWDAPKLMQHAMTWLLKAVAPAVNAAGTLSRLGTILFINAPDQLIGTVAARAGAQAHAVRLAAQEAAELGLEGKALTDYLKARMVQLTETVDGFADDSYSAGQREVALAHGAEEARGVLFQDQLELGVTRALSTGLSRTPLVHMIVPFIRTPLRILERTTLDFTPVGLLKDRLRADIVAGGARRDEALARIGLGTLMVYTAFQLAEDRTIIGSDGSYKSSARLSRPSFTLKIGDDLVEFNRIDPLGTLLGWGADVQAYLRDQEDNPQASGEVTKMIEAAVIATSANVLAKTWLVSLRNLVELSSDVKSQESANGWAKYAQTFGARLMPASGIQRSIQKGVDDVVRDASGVIEGLIKASVGADTLPVKRDMLLGRPTPVESGERLLGVKGGPGPSDLDDPLLKELEELSFDVPIASRTLKGVRLNSHQFNRWLELRGQVVRHDATGLTLEETLSALITLPEYQALGRQGRVAAVRDEMRGFSRLATEQLAREDDDFARRALAEEVWTAEAIRGSAPEVRDAELERLSRELGLTE